MTDTLYRKIDLTHGDDNSGAFDRDELARHEITAFQMGQYLAVSLQEPANMAAHMLKPGCGFGVIFDGHDGISIIGLAPMPDTETGAVE